MVPKFLRLRSEARRNDIIRVYNDTVMKLEAVIIGLEREKSELKGKIDDLRATVEALQAASTTTEEV